jgi:hypothetical protein
VATSERASWRPRRFARPQNGRECFLDQVSRDPVQEELDLLLESSRLRIVSHDPALSPSSDPQRRGSGDRTSVEVVRHRPESIISMAAGASGEYA